jgi:ribulose bisphosphate carboxylase small subunit
MTLRVSQRPGGGLCIPCCLNLTIASIETQTGEVVIRGWKMKVDYSEDQHAKQRLQQRAKRSGTGSRHEGLDCLGKCSDILIPVRHE